MYKKIRYFYFAEKNQERFQTEGAKILMKYVNQNGNRKINQKMYRDNLLGKKY